MNFMTSVRRVAVFTLLIFAAYSTAAAQSDSIYRLAAGTRITLKLDAEINSQVSGVDDTFVATLARPVIVRETVVLPAGTTIEGRVTAVRPASAGGKGGRLELAFQTLRLGRDIERKIDAELVNKLSARSGGTFSALAIIGGAAAGALIGAVSGSSRGALIGAGVGAAAGSGAVLAKRGDAVGIRKDAEFEIVLKRDVTLPVLDY